MLSLVETSLISVHARNFYSRPRISTDARIQTPISRSRITTPAKIPLSILSSNLFVMQKSEFKMASNTKRSSLSRLQKVHKMRDDKPPVRVNTSHIKRP